MYLKRLESVGFKSFAERINIEFVPGVTAVVGPNGSGKSNITDAIRWVLGAQSVRSLRGSKMEDIIFQGSDTRNPLNVAEVTLILDNHDHTLPLDYKEISVTRRVYRSGASEFYINKQSCRLKDIIDLFMDSGLGSEAYSIISQGKVEEVLSSKPDERRVIFEEAAGVLKYKQRKQKAEFKLSETNENLNRVDDIIYEVEQQIDPLYKQSEIAKQYMEKTEQLKEKEISLLITEIEQLHAQWQQLISEVERNKEEEIKLKTNMQTREATIESKRQSIQQIDHDIEELQTKLLKTTQELEQYDGKKQVWGERLKHLSENKEKLEQQKNDTFSSIEELRITLAEEKKKLNHLRAQRQETKTKTKHIQSSLAVDKKDITEKIEEQKAEYIEFLNKQAAKRNEQQTIQKQIKKISHQNNIKHEKYEELLKMREKYKKEKELILKEYAQIESSYNNKQTNTQHLKKNLNEKRNQFDHAQRNLYKGYQKIATLRSKKEMLEEMNNEFQGFFHGVKSILKARERHVLHNIYGAVIELIDVPKKYLTAVETVLSSQAQNIVVKDDHSARVAISWLKKTNNGRATFLPRESIRPRYLATEILVKLKLHPGFIGVAANLINTEKKYQIVVDFLMGNVVIAKSLIDANEISTLLNRRYRVVTLEGDVVNPGGSMSGGAKSNKKHSLFTREKDLEETIVELKNLQTKANTFEKKLEKRKQQIEQIEQDIIEKEKHINKDQAILQTMNDKHQNIKMKLISLHENISNYENDHHLFKQDIDDLHVRNNHLIKDLSMIEQQLLRIQEKIDHLSQEEKDFNKNREDMRNNLHEYQVTLAEQEERERNQREKTHGLNQQIIDLEDQFQTHETELKELLKLQQSEETRRTIEQTILQKKSEKENYTEKVQQERMKRLKHTQFIEDEERELKDANKQYELLMQTIQKKEVKINRLDVDLENRLSQLQADYTITYERARDIYNNVDNMEETKNEVNQLKQSIKNLGSVNLGAIDEYKRISDRYEFLTDQKDDLVEAKQTLYTIISEMDEVMKQRFNNTFSHIKREFSIVFKELFGGGNAELKLTDPQNILETGIDIIAQPPGKKLQHLGLLSGGEKSLTAIALLFSILRVRPVPFCVLDEVEAALDEVNVVRFAKYVKLHSDETQFIVITHRKGTMEEADVLYGVTMQESGVSRLVSVQLEETRSLVSS